jgi:hypothetical protein
MFLIITVGDFSFVIYLFLINDIHNYKASFLSHTGLIIFLHADINSSFVHLGTTSTSNEIKGALRLVFSEGDNSLKLR